MITVNIKFKNGSKISSLHNNKETKRGIIRGRRLSDKEYGQIIDKEIANAENKVSELLIAIVNYPDDVKLLNKEEFGIWLSDYWK